MAQVTLAYIGSKQLWDVSERSHVPTFPHGCDLELVRHRWLCVSWIGRRFLLFNSVNLVGILGVGEPLDKLVSEDRLLVIEDQVLYLLLL